MSVVNKKMKDIYCKFFCPHNEVKNVIIAIHGFAGDKDSSVIEAFAKKFDNTTLVVSFDLPCHGEDKMNKLDLYECLNYLSTIIEYIEEQYRELPISIFATSFGAYLFLNYLKNTKYVFNNIVLRAPAIFMDKVLINSILKDHNISLNDLSSNGVNLGYSKEIFVDKKFVQDLKNNSLKNCIYSQHINIIQGDRDEVVNVKENESFYKSNFKDYTLYYIKGADHRFKKQGELEQILSIVASIM